MKIAIIGSWREGNREWGLLGSHSEFEKACLEIGREIGHNRQIVIVGSQSLVTADIHVVRGVIEAVRNQKIEHSMIEVLRTVGDSSAYEDLARENPGLFSFYVPIQSHWAETHLLSIREANVVITIAGMKGTYQAGLATIISKKNLVPVSSFGGASAKLSAILETIGELHHKNDHRFLNGPWNPASLGVVAKLAGIGQPPKVLLIHGRSKDWLRLKDWMQESANVKEVLVMQQEFGCGRTLPEKFEQLAAQVDFAIALATPDDIGGLLGSEVSSYRQRARQNVWLEIGWFWGRLGRDRVLVLSRGQIETPSDLSGIEFYEYAEDPIEREENILAFLGQA